MKRPWAYSLLSAAVALLSGILPAGGARNYYFSHLTSDDGLSHNTIKCIVQDSYGFMWLGTKNGLNRYDGKSIRIVDCDDRVSGRGNHNISALWEDPSRRLWVGTDKGVFVYDPVSETFTSFDHASEAGVGVNNWIAAICGDNDGNVWILSPTEGAFRWDGATLRHYRVTSDDTSLAKRPSALCVRRNGQVWIGTEGDGLYRYYPGGDRFEQVLTDKNGNSLKGDNIYAMCEYGGSIAIAVHEGDLKKYDIQNGLVSRVDAPGVHGSLLRDVEWFGGRELWVATHEGVFVVDEEDNRVTHLREESFNSYALSDKTCSVLYRDRENGVWVGTMLGGVNHCAVGSFEFDKYIPYDRAEGVLCKKIRGLAEGPDGRIWIGTEDEGLCVLDPRTGESRTIEYRRARRERMLNTLEVSACDGELWYGLFKNGIGVMDTRTGGLRHLSAARVGITEESVYSILKDSRGNLWLGTAAGVWMRRSGAADFTPMEGFGVSWVFDIVEDSRGYIWAAMMGIGVCRYDPADGSVRYYSNDPATGGSLGSNSASSVFEDSRGRIWVSTDRGGLCRYNSDTDDFTSFSTAQGLPDDVVYKVLEDSRGMLWFGTNRGLVEFDPDSGKVVVYTREDGLLGNQFNYNAAMKDSSGRLWFGGVDGLIAFSPEKSAAEGYTPPLYITRLTIDNVEQTIGGPGSPLGKSILFTEDIELDHRQSNIGIDFTAVQFSHRNDVEYLYRMEGVEQQWIAAGNSGRVYYSQLSPGVYVFHTMIRDATQGWEHRGRPLHIVVRPPWWWTGVAKVLYVLLLAAAVALGVNLFLRRKRAKMLEHQRLFEVEKEKELYRYKVDFFNEIAHEIRTPLTLISSPLEDVIEMNADPRLDKELKTMSKNARRLLDLIHQLLDFRSVDANKFRMNYVRASIPALVAEIAERFEPSMQKRGKRLAAEYGAEDFTAAVDREAFTKIVSNLLGNAMKYAVSRISVTVRRGADSFAVEVSSDGEKIPIHLADRIFEPFYRIERDDAVPGTGIGLSLSRSLAQLHKGHLVLDVARGEEGNVFVLTLPTEQEGVVVTDVERETGEPTLLPDPDTDVAATSKQGYRVLLVEDNLAIRDYIADRLGGSCDVLVATDGNEALEILRGRNVDLVVSDIVMPGMDGMELCRRMKGDETMQYTPVVFLTARSDLQAKIRGLEVGAEAFVEKPFSLAYLKALVFSIMENRRKERESFAKLPFAPASSIRMNAADMEFIDKVIAVIHENIAEEQLGVEFLSECMCMNRSSLLRKIKSLTNISAVDFIKVVRLKQAALMLREGRYRIGEVCYAVGINSPSYFSKLFQQQFGMLPKEFERQNHKL